MISNLTLFLLENIICMILVTLKCFRPVFGPAYTSSSEYGTFEKNIPSVVAKDSALQVSVNEVKLVISIAQAVCILSDVFSTALSIFEKSGLKSPTMNVIFFLSTYQSFPKNSYKFLPDVIWEFPYRLVDSYRTSFSNCGAIAHLEGCFVWY